MTMARPSSSELSTAGLCACTSSPEMSQLLIVPSPCGRDSRTQLYPHPHGHSHPRARGRPGAAGRAGGRPAEPGEPLADVLAAQATRDARDRRREHGALRAADDAVEIDTTGRKADDVARRIAALAAELGVGQ